MLNIQLEKATPDRRRKNKGFLHRLRAKTYHLPAHVTSEEDWQRDVPNVKLSRAFAIVLGIHVVAIGGFMAFELFRHKDSTPGSDPAQDGRLAGSSQAAPATVAPTIAKSSRSQSTAQRTAEPNLDDPANEGLKTYVVGPGETLTAIANKLKVDERLLAEKNNIGDQRPLESGMKLVIPNHQIVAQKPEDVEKLLADRSKSPESPSGRGPQEQPTPSDRASGTATSRAAALPKVAAKMPLRADDRTARPGKKAVAATETEKPIRKAEAVGETPQTRPNRDPKRLTAPPATFAAAQASRLSTASGSSPKIAEKQTAAKGAAGKGSRQGAGVKSRGRTHVVAEGETAYRIARTYKVDVATLIKANGIKPATLRPGTQLVIPAAAR
ncbi:MAG: LysM peptidoglycan-binding domain-containing protein [Verrucomicrobiales bacterium]